ncbi:CWF19-like protein 2 [Morus notabilis]|uniref:CWF19-like protein 2 n=1 Tax=Morus notabilis TaxID=981085 RepID=UPI000CED72A8|nr:CWF19-like protein 2 [Morus notabilis]
MLGGVKFIPRDQIDKDDSSDALKKDRKKSGQKDKRDKGKKRSSSYSSSDEELERVKRSSRKKKWYSSDEYSSSSYSSESDSGKSSSKDEKRRRRRKKGRRRDEDDDDSSGDEAKGRKKARRKGKEKRSRGDIAEHDMSEDSGGANSFKDKEIVRAEMGLEWMLRPEAKMDRGPRVAVENEPEEAKNEEIKKVNPRELNPYLKDNGRGYPEEKDDPKAGSSKLPSSSLVGDGGASWRLKALKRAKEQAARDGKRVEEVVEERWGSLGQLAVSVSSHKAAPTHAHLNAINSRKRGVTEESQAGSESEHKKNIEKGSGRDYLKDISLKLPKMRAPKVKDSLAWGKRKSQNVSTQDDGLISEAVSSLNKFSNDGSFMREVLQKQSNKSDGPAGENEKSEIETSSVVRDSSLSANQLAAKAFQLRVKGKHEEAEKLLQEVENIKAKQDGDDYVYRPRKEESSNRHVMQDMSLRRKKNEDDADRHLAQKIMQNKQYSTYGQADDEYDFDDGPSRKSRKKRPDNDQAAQRNTIANRFSIKQEDCIFCYENPRRPAHLVVAVANFTYLMLPQWEPVAPGHCCILPMQHVPSTRSVDDYVWEEIRNLKKCLIMMFGEQEKDVVFLETVMGLGQQRRHCMVECVPLDRELAEEAPHYFKMEIEEAESEWSRHNAKKLIDTSVKGLRKSIPENLPYFHVEFGLKKGFLHPIDDEKQFKSNFGLNVIRGILKVPEEDMYRRRRRRYESTEEQKQAAKSFARDWARFDWTKQLHEES